MQRTFHLVRSPVRVRGDRVYLDDIVPLLRGSLLHVHVVIADHADQINGGLVIVGDHGVTVVHGKDAGTIDHLLHRPFVITRITAGGLPVHPIHAVTGDKVTAAVQILPVGDDRVIGYRVVDDVLNVDHAIDVNAEIASQRLLVIAVGAVSLHDEILIRRLQRIDAPVARLIGRDGARGINLVLSKIDEAALRRISILSPGKPIGRIRSDRSQKFLQAADLSTVSVHEAGRGVYDGAVVLASRRQWSAVDVSARV